MASRTQPIFIPDRGPNAQQTGMGPYNQANGYPGQLDVERSDHGTSTSFLNQDPHTPDIDKVYGSVSPLIPTFGSSLPEPSWTQFDANCMLYSANNSPESSFRVGRSGTTVADEAPRTMNNIMPHSTPFMSQDRDVPRTFFSSRSALSAPIPPLPVDTEYDLPDIMCRWIGCSYEGGFSRKASLWRHIQDQHLQRNLTCSMCFETFGRKDKLNNHLRHVHSDIGVN